MIGANVPIYVALDPVDMRKSDHTPALAVREQLGLNPESGALYVFAGKGGQRRKVLVPEKMAAPIPDNLAGRSRGPRPASKQASRWGVRGVPRR